MKTQLQSLVRLLLLVYQHFSVFTLGIPSAKRLTRAQPHNYSDFQKFPAQSKYDGVNLILDCASLLRQCKSSSECVQAMNSIDSKCTVCTF